MKKVKISVLDLAVITQSGNAAISIERAVKVAQRAEELGYERVWLAEHHNMEFVASSATAVLIGHVAGQTKSIRVGSGGVMLPNHAPLVIAEQFGTLETMYPGRIDLGLGRAPGTDQLTAAALRRGNLNTSFQFPADVKELQQFFSEENQDSRVRAFPAEGLNIPIWILGSSTDSAYLAAEMGLPYAFAAHFAPGQLLQAIEIYRRNFKPSSQLAKPYVLVCVNVIAGETDEEAEKLSTSMYRMFAGIVTNRRAPLMPPVDSLEPYFSADLYEAVSRMTACSFIGGPETLKSQLSEFLEETSADEIMAASNIYDVDARIRSYEILKEVLD